MYSMKDACKLTNLSYETLKYYCNLGLVPNVKRDSNNYRIFADNDIAWINSLHCLKNCDFTIKEMKQYMLLCFEGEKSIPERKKILEEKEQVLLSKIIEINKAIDYIHSKQKFYDDVLANKTKYQSNLIKVVSEE